MFLAIYVWILKMFALIEYQAAHTVPAQNLAGNFKNIFGCNVLYLGADLLDGGYIAGKKQALSYGKAAGLGIVSGNGELAYHLFLGRRKHSWGKRFIHKSLEFLPHQAHTLVQILLVAPEVDAENAGVLVGNHACVYVIYKGVLFPQR